LDAEEARRRFGAGRVGRLATVSADGTPHVVPFVFALDGDTIWWAIDHKRKRSRDLKRLDNIRANPRVEAVVDAYDEDWSRLWWVRASGQARILEDDQMALQLLRAKYPQYRTRPPAGPFVAIGVERWSGWEV
jgi:PPOX class probable F420-dependent enzyme